MNSDVFSKTSGYSMTSVSLTKMGGDDFSETSMYSLGGNDDEGTEGESFIDKIATIFEKAKKTVETGSEKAKKEIQERLEHMETSKTPEVIETKIRELAIDAQKTIDEIQNSFSQTSKSLTSIEPLSEQEIKQWYETVENLKKKSEEYQNKIKELEHTLKKQYSEKAKNYGKSASEMGKEWKETGEETQVLKEKYSEKSASEMGKESIDRDEGTRGKGKMGKESIDRDEGTRDKGKMGTKIYGGREPFFQEGGFSVETENYLRNVFQESKKMAQDGGDVPRGFYQEAVYRNKYLGRPTHHLTSELYALEEHSSKKKKKLPQILQFYQQIAKVVKVNSNSNIKQAEALKVAKLIWEDAKSSGVSGDENILKKALQLAKNPDKYIR